MILLDTNVLVRLVDAGDPKHKLTQQALIACGVRETLVVSDQILQEFWAVATKTLKVNGLGIPTAHANQLVTHFEKEFKRLADPPTLFDTWRTLVATHDIRGTKSFDARIAAFLIEFPSLRFMTLNRADFSKYQIVIVDPQDPSTW